MKMGFRATLTMTAAAIAVAAFTGCAKEKERQVAETSAKEVAQAPTPEPAPAEARQASATIPQAATAPDKSKPAAGATHGLPRLVDLGRGTCIPCKQMAPILSELSQEYRGRAVVEAIDLRDEPGAAAKYGIKLIPTQIFFNDKGAEVWRHEGFLPKDQIVAKFAELGVKPK
jgi:thioredoxin 1